MLMDSSFRISSGAVSDRGLSEKRPQNEDSYLEMSKIGIYAVADGVGGAQAGEVASQMAMEILGEAFANRHDGDDAETVMRTAIEQANVAIHQMAHELPQLSSMATTVVALHLDENIATIGHVGDSRLYRVDRDGNLNPETDDHSMVAEEVRAGRMTAQQAENHPSRNVISRALGAETTVDVDLKTIMVDPGTAFLICSDGITRHVSDQEIKGVLTFGGAPAEICEYLKNLCYERGAEDNLTAVVVKIAATHSIENQVARSLAASDTEEPTIATARSSFENQVTDEDEGELLELETGEISIPDTTLELPTEHVDDSETISIFDEERPQPVTLATPQNEKTEPVEVASSSSKPMDDSFSMFGDSGTALSEEEKSGSVAKIASAFAMLVLGSLIGLGIYHFALVPKPADPPIDQRLSVMRTDDIAFSSFEKNRRNVDANPEEYIREVPPASDAEDYYLIGRAYLLVGDFPKARLALIEAQKQIAQVEPANAKILNTDIATALVLTTDPTIQSRLKLELDAVSRQLSNPNANQ